MTEEHHSAIQNRYYGVIRKMEELETQIKNTANPTEQALLRTDYRALLDEKEEILNDLIDVKP